MADDILSPRSSYGKTFIIAMWVLGGLGAGQVVAVGWAVLTQKPRQPIVVQAPPIQPQPEVGISLPEPGGPIGGSIPTGTQNGGDIAVSQPAPVVPPIRSGVLPGPSFEPPRELTRPRQQPLGTALETTALDTHPAHRIDDRLVERMVATGEELRGTGNMQGALKALRSAEEILPSHPRVLAELAGTFSLMGLEEKALDYWEQIYRLGEKQAGGYYDLASMALKGNSASVAGTTAAVLKIHETKVKKDESANIEGEKVTLTVTVEGDSKVRPSGSEMGLSVYFFDKVDGRIIDATTADTKQQFPTAPYDWQGGSKESVDVVYHQPVFSVEQQRDLGKREYYGYVIELYYRDKLQDTRAEPESLLEFHSAPIGDEPKIGSDESLSSPETND